MNYLTITTSRGSMQSNDCKEMTMDTLTTGIVA